MKLSTTIIAMAISCTAVSAHAATAKEETYKYNCTSVDGSHEATIQSKPNRPYFAQEAFSPTIITTVKNLKTREKRKQKVVDGWVYSGDEMDINYEGQKMFVRYLNKNDKVVATELFCKDLKKLNAPLAEFEVNVEVAPGYFNDYEYGSHYISKEYINGETFVRVKKNKDFNQGTELNICYLTPETYKHEIQSESDTQINLKVIKNYTDGSFSLYARTDRAIYNGHCSKAIAKNGRTMGNSGVDEMGTLYSGLNKDLDLSEMKETILKAFPAGMIRLK